MGEQRRWTQSWLGGTAGAGVEAGYPGQRLGLPETGAGSVGRFGRRLAAITIDWLICTWAIAQGLLRMDPATAALWTPVIFGIENLLLISTVGSTLGMRLLGLRVRRLDGSHPSPLAALIRTLLLILAIPAMIWDRDQRGLHDKAAKTVIVRT